MGRKESNQTKTKTNLQVFDQVMLKPVCFAKETKLENENSACSKFRYDTFQYVNNKGADQTAVRKRKEAVGWSLSLLFAYHEAGDKNSTHPLVITSEI